MNQWRWHFSNSIHNQIIIRIKFKQFSVMNSDLNECIWKLKIQQQQKNQTNIYFWLLKRKNQRKDKKKIRNQNPPEQKKKNERHHYPMSNAVHHSQ